LIRDIDDLDLIRPTFGFNNPKSRAKAASFNLCLSPKGFFISGIFKYATNKELLASNWSINFSAFYSLYTFNGFVICYTVFELGAAERDA